MKFSFVYIASASVAIVASFAAGVYFSTPTYKAADNGLMVDVPAVGYSRIESVDFCLTDVKVKKYQDLKTDEQFETFNKCLVDLT
jgi:hypothetical protein